MGIVVLGVSGIKTGRRRRFGYFGGGELETTDLGSGKGCTPQCAPTWRFSKPRCWGFVNTKNWYRKGTDLWAEFGKEAPFGRKFSSKDLVKILAVGSTPSFGRRAVCT
jgi:hypothetical protein